MVGRRFTIFIVSILFPVKFYALFYATGAIVFSGIYNFVCDLRSAILEKDIVKIENFLERNFEKSIALFKAL